MDVITMEATAYKELIRKIEKIADLSLIHI